MKAITSRKKNTAVSTGTAASVATVSTRGARVTATIKSSSASKQSTGTEPNSMVRAGSSTCPSSSSLYREQIPSESRNTVLQSTGKRGPNLISAFAKSLDRSSTEVRGLLLLPWLAPSSSSHLKRKIGSGTLTSSAGSKRKCNQPAAIKVCYFHTLQESREKCANRMFLSPQTKLYLFFL